MLKYYCILSILIGLTLQSRAQNALLDSLRLKLTTVAVDSERVAILNDIAFANISIDPMASKNDVIEAYKLAKKNNLKLGMARSLVVMGGVYWAFGNYEQSLSHYLEALKAYQDLSNVRGQSNCLNNIGEVYKKIGQYDNSLDYLQKALALKEQLDGEGNAPLSYSNLGELYTLMGQFDKAQDYYVRAMLSAKEANNKRVLAYATDGTGMLYLAQEKYMQAIEHFYQGAKLRKQINDVRGLAYSFVNLGKSYFHLNEIDSAELYYSKGMNAAKKSSAIDVRLNLYKALSKLDSSKNDYEAAFSNYVKYEALKDSVYNDNKASQIARMEAEYQNELLRSENEAKNIAVKQRNTLIIGVIMLLILTLALAYTFNKQRDYQKKVNETLFAKNAQIEKQNLEIQKQAVKLKALNDNLSNLNHNLEEKIRQRTQELQKTNKELADYAFIHAHELRAPLSNILGLVQLLNHSNIDKKEREMIDHLHAATDQLDQVIKRIAAKEPSEDEIKS